MIASIIKTLSFTTNKAIVMGRTMSCGIYAIANRVNGKRYIGSAVFIERRWSEHRNRLRKNTHDNQHLQHAWNKYGESSFTFVVMELVLPPFLLDIEQQYLDANKGGYNIGMCAEASRRGTHHSPETRAKMSIAHKGKPLSVEHYMRLCESRKGKPSWNRGKPNSTETRAKISAARKGTKMHPNTLAAHIGRKASAETKAKMSIAQKGRKHTLASRIKISIAKRNMSSETRAKLSIAAKRRQAALRGTTN